MRGPVAGGRAYALRDGRKPVSTWGVSSPMSPHYLRHRETGVSGSSSDPLEGPDSGEGAPSTEGITIAWARGYDLGWTLSFGLDRRLWRMVLELCGVIPGESVLDIGCGTGRLALAAAAVVSPSREAHGIDASPEMIEVARRKSARSRAGADFKVGLIEDIPFDDGRFDLVMSTLVMHHLPVDLKRKGFAEVYRVLKPGGRFVAVDLKTPDSMIYKVLAHVVLGHHMASSDIRDSLEPMREARLSDIETGATPNQWFAFIRGVKPTG